MSIRSTVIAGCALVIALAGSAKAGDIYLPSGGSLKDYPDAAMAVPAPTPIPETLSWYLRADIGGTWTSNPDMTESAADGLSSVSYGDNWYAGGGIGYYFSTSLRGDLTLDFNSDNSLSARNTNLRFTDVGDNNGRATHRIHYGPGGRNMDVTTTLGLVNLYKDFGDFGGFSPYVGLGVGFARHKLSGKSISGQVETLDQNGAVTNTTSGTVGTITSGEETTLAAAFHTGFSYGFEKGYHLDAGYSLVYMGGAKSGEIVVDNGANIYAAAGKVEFDDILQHRLRVGLRYDIW